MKGSTSCRVCGRWFEGPWFDADEAGRKEIQRQMDQGHCDGCTPPPPQRAREETPEERAARHALNKPLIEAFKALRPKPRTRAELLQLKMVHGAAAAAAEAELKDRARRLFEEEGSADTWRLADGQVITSTTNDHCEIVDHEAFLAWLAVAYPHQVQTRTVTEPINNAWVLEELFTKALTPLDPEELASGDSTGVMDAEGSIVPGVAWRRGGGLHGVSIRPDPAVARRLKAAAAAYIDGTGPLPGIETGEIRGGNTEDDQRDPGD